MSIKSSKNVNHVSISIVASKLVISWQKCVLECDFQALLNVDDVFKTRGDLFCILKIRDAVQNCHKSLYITYIICD